MNAQTSRLFVILLNLILMSVIAVPVFAGQSNTKQKENQKQNLFAAVQTNDITKLEALLKQGADINARDRYGWTPLFWAVQERSGENHSNLISALLRNGAAIEAKDKTNCTPLMHAAESGDEEAISILLNKGANARATDSSGMTAVMCAMTWTEYDAVMLGKEEAHLRIARKLLDAGADINAQRKDGFTALMLAIWKNHSKTAKGLIGFGADVNLKDKRCGFDRAVMGGGSVYTITAAECAMQEAARQWLWISERLNSN